MVRSLFRPLGGARKSASSQSGGHRGAVFSRERRFDSQGSAEVGQHSPTVRGLLRPKSELRRIQAGLAPTVALQKGPRGSGSLLIKGANAGQFREKGA